MRRVALWANLLAIAACAESTPSDPKDGTSLLVIQQPAIDPQVMTFLPPLAARSPLVGASDTSYATAIEICRNAATTQCGSSDLIVKLTARPESSAGESYYIAEWKPRDSNLAPGDVVRVRVFALGWEVGLLDLTIRNANSTIPIKFQLARGFSRASVFGPAATKVAGLVSSLGNAVGPAGSPPVNQTIPTLIFATDVSNSPLLAGITEPGKPLAISGVTSAQVLVQWLSGTTLTLPSLLEIPAFTQLAARIDTQAAAGTPLTGDAVTMQLAASILSGLSQPAHATVAAARQIVPAISSSQLALTVTLRFFVYPFLDVTSGTRITFWGELNSADQKSPVSQAKEVTPSGLVFPGITPFDADENAFGGGSPITHTFRFSQTTETRNKNAGELITQSVSLLLAVPSFALPLNLSCFSDGISAALASIVGWQVAVKNGDSDAALKAIADEIVGSTSLALLASCATGFVNETFLMVSLKFLNAGLLSRVVAGWDAANGWSYITAYERDIGKSDQVTFCAGSAGLSTGVCPMLKLIVSPTTLSLNVNESGPITAQVIDAATNVPEPSPTIGFLSRNPQVASVSALGIVTGVTEGSAYILAESSSLRDSVLVSVQSQPQTRLLSVTRPSNGVVGQFLSPLSVSVRDQQGNIITSPQYQVTIALSANPTNAVLSGTTTVATVNGIAAFPNLTIDRAGEGFTLTATAQGATATVSAPFNVTEEDDGSGTALDIKVLGLPQGGKVTITNEAASFYREVTSTTTLTGLAAGKYTVSGILPPVPSGGIVHIVTVVGGPVPLPVPPQFRLGPSLTVEVPDPGWWGARPAAVANFEQTGVVHFTFAGSPNGQYSPQLRGPGLEGPFGRGPERDWFPSTGADTVRVPAGVYVVSAGTVDWNYYAVVCPRHPDPVFGLAGQITVTGGGISEASVTLYPISVFPPPAC